jgi:hypothetical protein
LLFPPLFCLVWEPQLLLELRENKKEKIRQVEREQDHLKLEVKDLKNCAI